jgi:acyl-CoA synthetase (AMP-forming)/AMP-acid ligase II
VSYNIADLYELLVDAVPDNDAIACGDKKLTFVELDRRANRLAHFLGGQGVKAGDHVGLHMYNDAEYVEAMLGCMKVRAVPININYRYVAEELRYMLDDADLVGIISHGDFTGIVDEAAAGSEKLRLKIVVEDGAAFSEGWVPYEAALAGASDARGFAPRSGEDLFVVYTGGTTGMPKGVMWRHEDLFFAGLQGGSPGGDPVESEAQLVEQCVEGWYARTMLPCAPFIHGAAQFTAFICLFTGAKLVVQQGKSFDAARVLSLIAEEEISTLLIVGDAMAQPLLAELRRDRAAYDTSNLVVIASAGAILSPAIKNGLIEQLGEDVLIINNFGTSESGHAGTAADDNDDGRPSFYMDETCSVFDPETWEPIVPGSGAMGMIARTGHLPVGYYKDEAKTAERFRIIGDKRWVVPGDFATIEEDGRITFLGRGSKCINTGGEKVFPEEVEEALKAHPDVVDCLVVGIPDDRWGQRVGAVVSLVEGAALSLDDVQAHARKLVAGYKVPRDLVLAASIERFPSGKPDYAWAEKLAREGAAASA